MWVIHGIDCSSQFAISLLTVQQRCIFVVFVDSPARFGKVMKKLSWILLTEPCFSPVLILKTKK